MMVSRQSLVVWSLERLLGVVGEQLDPSLI